MPDPAASLGKSAAGTEDAKLVHPAHVRLSHADLAHLDLMTIEGGFASRVELIRSLLRAIIADDKVAHRKTGT